MTISLILPAGRLTVAVRRNLYFLPNFLPWHIETLHLMDLPDTRFCVANGGLHGKNLLFPGHLKDVKETVIDSLCLQPHPFRSIALKFIDRLNYATSVDDKIRRIEDPAVLKHLSMLLFVLQLIIGAACHQFTL